MPTVHFVRLAFLMVILLIGPSCKQSHDDAKKIQRGESQLELPEMSAPEKKIADKRLEWNMETLYDAYDKIGSRDKKWDRNARSALKKFAQARSYGSNLKGFPELMNADIQRAVDLGCDDPMIKYLHARNETGQGQMKSLQIAQTMAAASDAMETSQYGEIRKFYAAMRALNAYLKVKPWRDEGMTYRDRMAQHFFALLEDKRTPIGEIDDAAKEFLVIVDRWGDKGPYDQMEALLMKNWSPFGETYSLQGQFYIDYAWKGRGSGYADKVTEEQWEMFRERLALAEKALLRGMEIDPKDGQLPMLMITVASAQNKEFPEMKGWWEKAMEANPNNYDACDKLLYFLLPKWGGSREAMLAFSRECVASDKFGGTVPLILADAHYTFNKNHGPADASYWLVPDVWPDIKLSFEKFFELNPKAIGWRHNYARYAYWCQQWDAFQDQVNLMGDDINYSYFGGREKYDEMVALAAQNVSLQTK